MKRFAKVLLLFVLVCFCAVGYAGENPKKTVSVSENSTSISSSYIVFAENPKKEKISFYVQKLRFFQTTSSSESRHFSLIVFDNDKEPIVVFSKKNLPYITYESKAGKQTLKLPYKKGHLSDMQYQTEIGADVFKPLLTAKTGTAKLHLYFKDGKTRSVNIPGEVIQQWDEVLNADLKKIRREYENR